MVSPVRNNLKYKNAKKKIKSHCIRLKKKEKKHEYNHWKSQHIYISIQLPNLSTQV